MAGNLGAIGRRNLLGASIACLLIILGQSASIRLGHSLQFDENEQQQQQQVVVVRGNRVRRQQDSAQLLGQPQRSQTNVNVQSGAQAASMSLASSLDIGQPNLSMGSTSNQAIGAQVPQPRPPKVGASSSSSTGISTMNTNLRAPAMNVPTGPLPPMDELENARRPSVSRGKNKRPRGRPIRPKYEDEDNDDYIDGHDEHVGRRGSSGRDNYDNDEDDYHHHNHHHDDEDEYCDDEDYGHQMFRPMRHMARMMGSVFDQMNGMASRGGFGDFPRGSNMAAASSVSDSDGYSRMSSLVNNNGRARGIISETRNGRTQTRRIGGGDKDGEDEE